MRQHFPLNSNGVEDAGQLPWIDGVPSTGTEGSYPGHAIVTDAEAELLALIDLAGLTRSGTDLTQVVQALSRGIYLGGFTGSANALAAALPNNGAIPALLIGMRFTGRTSVANTGAVTVALSGFGQAPGALQLLGLGGTPLKAGDLPVGADFDFRYDGAAFRLVGRSLSELLASIASSGLVPTTATADVTLYVATTGSDVTGTGTQAAPFKTPAAAASFGAGRFFFAGFRLIIQVADGTYPPPGVLPPIGGELVLQGNLSAPGNCTLAGVGPGQGVGLVTASGSKVTLRGFAVQNNGVVSHNVCAVDGGSLSIQSVILLTSSQIPFALVFSGGGGRVTILDGCTMAGGAAWMWYVLGPGQITMGANVAVTGPISFSIAVISVSGPGFVTYSVPTVAFVATSTVGGLKFSLTLNGALRLGANPNGFIPGSQDGSGGAYG